MINIVLIIFDVLRAFEVISGEVSINLPHHPDTEPASLCTILVSDEYQLSKIVSGTVTTRIKFVDVWFDFDQGS